MQPESSLLGSSNSAQTAAESDALIIRELEISAFGRFLDVVWRNVDPAINVIYGPNEAGKSTLYRFVETMLFGVYPANPAQHPYYPFDGRHMIGRIAYTGKAGREVWVERKLMSSPSATISVDGAQRSLNQNPVPEAAFLTRQVYASVFALGLDDLVAPADTNVWDDIQDRLLGGMNMDFLRTAREVIEDLENEASSIWRDNNRGKPRAKDIEREISAVRKREAEARSNSERIRAAVSEEAQRRFAIEELDEQQKRIDQRLARLRRLVPLRRSLVRLDDLNTQAGDVDVYDYIPVDPQTTFAELREQRHDLQKRRGDLETRLEQNREQSALATERDFRVAARRDEIRAWESRRGEVRAIRGRLDEERKQLERVRSQLEDHGRRILSDGWDEALDEVVGGLSIADIRAAIARYEACRQDEEAVRRRNESALSSSNVGEARIWLGVAAVGAVVAIIGIIGAEWIAAAIGMVGLAIGTGLFLERRRSVSRRIGMTEGIDAARETTRAARESVRDHLSSVPIPDDRLATPDVSIAHDLESLIRLVNATREAENASGRFSKEIEAAERDLRNMASELDVVYQNFDAAVDALSMVCEEATRRIETTDRAVKEAPEIERAIEAVREKLAQCDQRLVRYEAGLRELGDGEVETGASRLVHRRQARDRALSIAEEIRREEGSLDAALERVNAALAEDGDLFDDGAEAALESVRNEITAELRDHERIVGALAKEIAQLQCAPTLADVQSELERLHEELVDARTARDRLALAATVVREADRRFRAEHQPDVVRRASEYFRQMTSGRYDRIMLDGTSLYLILADGHRQIDVTANDAHISRGTRDQLYLAIRLALIDHLDASQTRLPVLLDEVFVNWDAHRRKGGHAVLESMSSERQIFLFTCHEWMRDELCDSLNANLITIDS